MTLKNWNTPVCPASGRARVFCLLAPASLFLSLAGCSGAPTALPTAVPPPAAPLRVELGGANASTAQTPAVRTDASPGSVQDFCVTLNGITWGMPVTPALLSRMSGMGLRQRSLPTGETAWTDGRGKLTVMLSQGTVIGITGTELSSGSSVFIRQGDPLTRAEKKMSKHLSQTDSSNGVFVGYGKCQHGNYFLQVTGNGPNVERILVLTDKQDGAHSAEPASPTPAVSGTPSSVPAPGEATSPSPTPGH
jgi:hypothetical protein